MYELTKHARKRKYVQIILVPLLPHQQGLYLCVDGVTNSLHIQGRIQATFRGGTFGS